MSAVQVEAALHAASRRGFDDVGFAGFNFDGAAQGVIQDDPNPRVRAHVAHIRPDVQMVGLLITQAFFLDKSAWEKLARALTRRIQPARTGTDTADRNRQSGAALTEVE